MSTLLLCGGCGGRKNVAPLGGIMKKCVICDGVGHIEHEVEVTPITPPEPLSIVEELVNQSSISTRVKYGRKKK